MRTPVPRIVAKPAAARTADTQQSTHTQRRQLATPLTLFCNGFTLLQKLEWKCLVFWGLTHTFDTSTLVVMLLNATAEITGAYITLCKAKPTNMADHK